jgi:RimJ/RimL family protein N-acetyltransferase
MVGMVSLREVVPEDIAEFYEFQADPVANEMAVFPARDRPTHDAHWAKILADPGNVTRAIVDVDADADADADAVVGNIASFVIDGERLVGYWVGRDYWGRGVASHALQLFVSDVEPRRPLLAHVVEQNLGSIRVLEKAGFTAIDRHTSDDDGITELIMHLA